MAKKKNFFGPLASQVRLDIYSALCNFWWFSAPCHYWRTPYLFMFLGVHIVWGWWSWVKRERDFSCNLTWPWKPKEDIFRKWHFDLTILLEVSFLMLQIQVHVTYLLFRFPSDLSKSRNMIVEDTPSNRDLRDFKHPLVSKRLIKAKSGLHIASSWISFEVLVCNQSQKMPEIDLFKLAQNSWLEYNQKSLLVQD